MAPSATTATASLVTDASKLKLYPGHVEGVYKELSPVVYKKEDELKGTDEYAAAKVSFSSPHGRRTN